MTTEQFTNPWILVLVPLISSGVGAYLGAYLKKKGENLATHEDISKLVDEVSAVTKTTKEIEAKISGELWDKQKRWEMKRDAIYEITKRLSAVDDALTRVYVRYAYFGSPPENEEVVDALARRANLLEVSKEFGQAAEEYERTLALMAVVCSVELCQALREFSVFARGALPRIQANPSEYGGASVEAAKQIQGIQVLLRKELGVE